MRTLLPCRPRRFLALADEARVEGADRHQPGAAETRAHLTGEPVYETEVLAHRAAQAGDLRLDLGDVGGDLRYAAGQQREIVVAIELQLGEQLGDRARRYRTRLGRFARLEPAGQAGLQMAPLEVGDRLAQAGPAGEEHVTESIEVAEPALEAAARHHELADEVHECIQTLERHPDGLSGAAWRRLAGSRARSRRRHRQLRRCRYRRPREGFHRSRGRRRDRDEQRGHARAKVLHGGRQVARWIGSGVQHLSERIDGVERRLHHRRGQRSLPGPHGHQQILEPVRELADRVAADDVGGSLERVDRAEERVELGSLAPSRCRISRAPVIASRCSAASGPKYVRTSSLLGEEAKELAPNRVAVGIGRARRRGRVHGISTPARRSPRVGGARSHRAPT